MLHCILYCCNFVYVCLFKLGLFVFVKMEVFVSDRAKANNPSFSKLLVEIGNKTANTTLSKEESKLWLAKSEWREDHLIFTTIQTILNEKQCEIQKNALSKEDDKCWKSVMKCFYVHQYPDCFSNNDSSLLSLNSTNLSNVFDSTEESLAKGKKMLAVAIENKLENMALKLTDIKDGANENAKIRLARAMQIGTILKDDRATLQANLQRLKDMTTEQANLQDAYHQTLKECSNLLINLISKYCLRFQPLKEKAIVKNAMVSCDTLAAKLKSIRAQLKCDTFTPPALEALKKLRSEIVRTINEREIELTNVEEQLEIYRRLGQDFEAIATEYGKTKNDLEKQKWTLDEIKENLATTS